MNRPSRRDVSPTRGVETFRGRGEPLRVAFASDSPLMYRRATRPLVMLLGEDRTHEGHKVHRRFDRRVLFSLASSQFPLRGEAVVSCYKNLRSFVHHLGGLQGDREHSSIVSEGLVSVGWLQDRKEFLVLGQRDPLGLGGPEPIASPERNINTNRPRGGLR